MTTAVRLFAQIRMAFCQDVTAIATERIQFVCHLAFWVFHMQHNVHIRLLIQNWIPNRLKVAWEKGPKDTPKLSVTELI